jgi:multidrug efflux pump subunit AcrA (membrane-fusion protein)
VQPGSPLLELGRLDRLWVEAHVPLDRVQGFAAGDPARVEAVSGAHVDGAVATIGRRVHEADRGLLVRVVVDDPDGRLIPGEPVRVRLERTAPPGAVRVPRVALVHLEASPAVFVADVGGFRPVPVTVLGRDDEMLVVRGGLDAGDAVVVRGTSAVRSLLEADAP